MASPPNASTTAAGTPPSPLVLPIVVPALDNTYGAIMLGTFGGLMYVFCMSSLVQIFDKECDIGCMASPCTKAIGTCTCRSINRTLPTSRSWCVVVVTPTSLAECDSRAVFALPIRLSSYCEWVGSVPQRPSLMGLARLIETLHSILSMHAWYGSLFNSTQMEALS